MTDIKKPGDVFDDLNQMMSKFGESDTTLLKKIEVTLSDKTKEIINGTEFYVDSKEYLIVLNNQSNNDTFLVGGDVDSWIRKRTVAPGVDIVAIYSPGCWRSMRHV